jgi:membrane-associated phospholipid phosphatase
MIDADKLLFGALPTKTLQDWWWNGRVGWLDFLFYIPYMLHFVLPFALAIIIWKTRENEYWRYITAFVGTAFFGFIVYVLFPAAPPWMASDMGLIEPITRVSSHIWFALGIQDFPTIYNEVAANQVAAVPSLHATFATLFAIFVIKLYSSRWRYLAAVYPVLIYVGTVYTGEHYVFDEIVGALLAVAGYYASPYVLRGLQRLSTNMRLFYGKILYRVRRRRALDA